MSRYPQTETAAPVLSPGGRILASKKLSFVFGLLIAALGTTVLVGWLLNVVPLKSIFPGLVTMKINTAFCMVFCGGTLALLSREHVSKPVRLLAVVLQVVVLAVGLLTLCEYLLGWELHIDQLFLRDSANPVGTSQLGRMSPATAFGFMLATGSLLAASRPSPVRLRPALLAGLGVALIVIGGLALAGYATDSLFALRWWNYTGMAVHTAAGFLLLGCGFLSLGRNEGGPDWTLDTLTTCGFVAGIISLLVATSMSFHFTNQLQASAGWVSHSQETLKEIGEVLANVTTLGSTQRNYINTGNEHLLEQDQAVKEAIQKNLAALRQLTAGNLHQQHRLDQLEPLIQKRMEWGDETIAARREHGLSAAEQIIAAGTGIALSDSIRRVTGEMKDEEYSLLAERQKKEQTIATTTFLLLPLGVFLSLTMLSLGLFFLNAGAAERARVQKRAAWLASFPEHNPNPILELDLPSGTIHYLNPSAARIMPDLMDLGLRHPSLADLADVQKKLLHAGTDVVRREIPVGELFFAQTITSVSDSQRLRVYSSDITARKRAEIASEQLAAIVSSSGDAIVGTDLDGVITSWNSGAEKLFGYAAGEMVGGSIFRLVPADWESQEKSTLERIRNGENIEHFETVRQARDRRPVSVSVKISSIRDSSGNIIGASNVERDITERKTAEETVRASEARYHTLFDYAPDGILIATPDSRYLDANVSICKMLGYTRAELIGLHASDIVVPQEIQNIAFALTAINVQSDYQREWQLRRKDGSHFPADVIATKMPDGNLLAVIRDITARKLAADEHEKLTQLVEHSRDFIAISDLEGRIIFMNSGGRAMIGLRPDEDPKKLWFTDYIPVEWHAFFRNTIFPTAHEFGLWEGEMQMRNVKTGAPFDVFRSTFLIRDTAGQPACYATVTRDITERKRATEALRDSEERFRTLANSIPQLAWTARADGSVVWYNQHWYEYTGTTPEQMEGSGWQRVHHPDVLPKVLEKWQEAIDSEEPFEMEFPLRGADGQYRTFLTRIQPLKDAENRVVNWFGTNTDVDTLKQAQETILKLNTELEQRVAARTAELVAANQELEAFSFSVSHDLRAPLRAVNGFAGIVIEQCGPQLDDEGKRYLERIRQGGLQMGVLIDDLLAFSRLGRQPANLQTINSSELVQMVLDDSTSQRGDRPIELNVGPLPPCVGDPSLLKQVWINLISNAIKYTRGRDPAVIEIGCQGKAGEDIFFIRDNGAGFDMQYANKLFGVFQRMHRADQFEGTGVGLAIVQRIVHRHGGRIWAEAAEGRGATFYFTLKRKNDL